MTATDEYSDSLSQLPPAVVVIGASRGIGAATVKLLSAMPHWQAIYAGSRSASSAVSASSSDERVAAFEIDCSNERSIETAFAWLSEQQNSIGLLINCAGLLHNKATGLQPEKQLADLSMQALEESFAVNSFGAALVMQQAAPLLRRQPARLVNVSARVGSIDDNHLGGWYSYRAAKAAQNMLTRTACIEIGRRNKNFAGMAFHPGTTDTDLSAPFQQNVPSDKLFSATRSAQQLLAVTAALTPAENGCFRAWDGSEIRW